VVPNVNALGLDVLVALAIAQPHLRVSPGPLAQCHARVGTWRGPVTERIIAEGGPSAPASGVAAFG
jgi:hypothetical protein